MGLPELLLQLFYFILVWFTYVIIKTIIENQNKNAVFGFEETDERILDSVYKWAGNGYGEKFLIVSIGRKGIIYTRYDQESKLPWFLVKHKFPKIYEDLGPRKIPKNRKLQEACRVTIKEIQLDSATEKAIEELEKTLAA